MVRKPSPKPTIDDNPLVPLSELRATDPESCYGRAWTLEHPDCTSRCGNFDACGIQFRAEVKKEAAKLEAEQGPYLDQARTPGDKFLRGVAEKIAAKHAEGAPLHRDKVIAFFSGYMRTKDTAAVVLAVKRMVSLCPEIFSRNGYFYSTTVAPRDAV